MYNKQLWDEVYCDMKVINVEVRVIISEPKARIITRAEALIILHITKTESNNSFTIHFKWKKTKTKSNNCFILDFKPKIINIARKTIKNKSRRLNMQITKLSVSQ